MIPTNDQIKDFFTRWLARYSFAITMDNGPEWFDHTSGLKMRRNHVVCIVRNDMLNEFPSMPRGFASKMAEKTVGVIEKAMEDKIRAGEGTQIEVPEEYL